MYQIEQYMLFKDLNIGDMFQIDGFYELLIKTSETHFTAKDSEPGIFFKIDQYKQVKLIEGIFNAR